jgi:hypothetical protein
MARIVLIEPEQKLKGNRRHGFTRILQIDQFHFENPYPCKSVMIRGQLFC